MNLPARIGQLFHDVFGTSPVLTGIAIACVIIVAGSLTVSVLARRR
jgi:hypothetical protein